METEADLLAAWCELLPALRDQARAEGVLDRLDRDAERVRTSGSARSALRRWRPGEPDADQRGWSDRPTEAMAQLPGWGAAAGMGAGSYVCPRERCLRRASRDALGHPPLCAAFAVPMQPA